ncbi:hypothetical protein AcV5_007329 [Taiwanofungus camphoratus]|nr:hypothetical protein AcV5_007329 [Antrodia cinnamomea]
MDRNTADWHRPTRPSALATPGVGVGVGVGEGLVTQVPRLAFIYGAFEKPGGVSGTLPASEALTYASEGRADRGANLDPNPAGADASRLPCHANIIAGRAEGSGPGSPRGSPGARVDRMGWEEGKRVLTHARIRVAHECRAHAHFPQLQHCKVKRGTVSALRWTQ